MKYFFINKLRKPRFKMGFIGDFEVIRSILKKKMVDIDKDNSLYVCALLPGGGQRGVIQGGVTRELEQLRLVDTIDVYAGFSTGAPVAWYTVGKNAVRGTTIYFEENVKNKFVDFKRIGKVMDIDTLEKVFREKKSVDSFAVMKSSSKLLVGVTDAMSGEGKLLDVKKFTDPLSCIVASINVPFLSGGKRVFLEGKEYIDGSIAYPFPVREVIDAVHPTDLLIIANAPLSDVKESLFERLGEIIHHKVYLSQLLDEICSFKEKESEELGFVLGERRLPYSVRVGMIYPLEDRVSLFTSDAHVLEEAAYSASYFTRELFTGTD